MVAGYGWLAGWAQSGGELSCRDHRFGKMGPVSVQAFVRGLCGVPEFSLNWPIEMGTVSAQVHSVCPVGSAGWVVWVTVPFAMGWLHT